MGIVVTVFMLLGLLMAMPFTILTVCSVYHHSIAIRFVGGGLLLAGMWNFLWHGLRHGDVFWGQAAIFSGFFMVMVAVIILKRDNSRIGFQYVSSAGVVRGISRIISSLLLVWIVGLLASFVLYSITLVRLNLGLSILS